MALNTFKCNYLTPLHFKGLTQLHFNHFTFSPTDLHLLHNKYMNNICAITIKMSTKSTTGSVALIPRKTQVNPQTGQSNWLQSLDTTCLSTHHWNINKKHYWATKAHQYKLHSFICGRPGQTQQSTLDSLHWFSPNVVAAGRCYAHSASNVMFRRPAWLCLRFVSCVVTQQNATFCGVAHPGGGLTQIQTRPRFVYDAPTWEVSSSNVYLFGSYRVDKHTHKHTNKQTLLKTSNALRYSTTLGNHYKHAKMLLYTYCNEKHLVLL